MKLDIVHDLQSVYRKMLDSTSRPGLISDLSKEAALVEVESSTPSLILLALTLFDQEVTFNVFSAQADKLKKTINQLTYAKPTETEQADYLLVLQDAEMGSLQEAIMKAKEGTLKNPHQSATILVEVGAVSNQQRLQLKGPGIQTAEYVAVDVKEDWLGIRQVKNKEYPLGVDLMFIDQNHRLLALPRTTQITEKRVMV